MIFEHICGHSSLLLPTSLKDAPAEIWLVESLSHRPREGATEAAVANHASSVPLLRLPCFDRIIAGVETKTSYLLVIRIPECV